jgi:hypothetical protein
MFDDYQGVARRPELEQHFEQFGDVAEVQAGGGFIEQVERASGGFAGEFGTELEPLSFPA